VVRFPTESWNFFFATAFRPVLWPTSNLIDIGSSFPWVKVAGEADHSLAPSVEVKNSWS
jgi:hypothetical protein